MQIRSVQAVSVAERCNQKPFRFSSLKSKKETNVDFEDVPALPLTNLVINKDLMQANSVAQMLSGKTLLERDEVLSYHRNGPNTSGTHQGQLANVGGGPDRDSRHNSTQNLSVKKQLQQKINTVEGFIVGVSDNPSRKNIMDDAESSSKRVSLDKAIPSVSLRPLVSQGNSDIRIIDSTHRATESREEILRNPQPIKVLATAKKTVVPTEHNYDMNTPDGIGLLDTAMKPVRLGSGYSDEATPTAQQQMLLPRNMLSTGEDQMSIVETEPQLTVITSHFQPKVHSIGGGEKGSTKGKNDNRQGNESPIVISQGEMGQESEFVFLRKGNANQNSTVLITALSSKRGQISSRQQNVQGGSSPKSKSSFRAGPSSFMNSHKLLRSATQSYHSQSRQSASPNRGPQPYRISAKDDSSDKIEMLDLKTQLQIKQIKPQTVDSRDRSPSRGQQTGQKTSQKKNTSRPVSDYKQSNVSEHRLFFKEDHPLIKLKTQGKIIEQSSEDQLVKVGPLRTPPLSNRRLLSNEGKSSSNSHRMLNSDIMLAKIDSSQDGSVVQHLRVGQIDTGEVRDGIDKKRKSTVLVHKLQNIDMRSEINSALLREEDKKKLGGTSELKKTEFITVDRDFERSMISQAPDGQTPKRQSVLARRSNNSKAYSNHKSKEVNLMQKSHVNTLQGTISSHDNGGQIINDLQMSSQKSQEQRQVTAPSISNELPEDIAEFQRDKKNISAITLKRESSAEIHKSDSRVLMSRVASLEQQDHAETMRDNTFVDPYSNHMLDDLAKKKAFSTEYSNGQTLGLASPGLNKQISNEMLLQLDEGPEVKRMTDKRSSQGLMVTSLGEESFIHPPSPIHQNEMMSRPLYDSPQKVCDARSGSESQTATHNAASKGPKLGIPSVQMFQKKAEGGVINAILVDVMHAGVDAQDFNELSENDTTQQQDLIMIDRDSDLIISQFGDGLKSNHQLSQTALLQQPKSPSKHEFNGSAGGGKMSQMGLSQPANQLKLMRNGQALPTVSCLCNELELTPEQFAYVVQQYKRQPRVIVKSETHPNKVLLVGEDGTSKDANVMENILQGTIKVDGLSISRMVNKNMDYFLSLEKNQHSPHRQRERRIQFQITRQGSEKFTSSRHTIDNSNMNQQLAQFMQYGQEFDAYSGGRPTSTFKGKQVLKSHMHSHVKHTNCADGKHIIGEHDGYNTPLLLSSQFLEQPSKMDSSHNQQMFGTQHIDSTYKDDQVNISLSPKTAYASRPIQESYHHNPFGAAQKSSDNDTSTGRQYYQTENENHTLKPKGTELLQSSRNSEMERDAAQKHDDMMEGQTHQNSVEDASNTESLAGLVPTKVEIFWPFTKRATQVESAPLNASDTLKIQAANTFVIGKHSKESVIRMEEQFYLDNHLARSSDMTNDVEAGSRFLGYIIEGEQKKRVITPSLGRRQGQKEDNYGSVAVAGDTRNLQPGKHFSGMSNNNKRSTLSKEFDVSTQWRHSNEASRYGGGDDQSADEGSFAEDQIVRERRPRTNTSKLISRANSLQRGKKVIRKLSQIGALTAACRLTPNKIEFKIKPGKKNREKEETEKDLLAREISVLQSKRGMIAEISRTFSSALSHKTNILRGTIRGTKVVTRSGITMVKKGQNEVVMQKTEPQFIFSKGRPGLNSSALTQTNGEDNSTITAEPLISRNLSGTHKTDQRGSRDLSSGKQAKLNQDLTTAHNERQQKSGESLIPWAGFNETRRMTANHISKRDKLIENRDRQQSQTRQMGETTSQMFLPAKDITSCQFSNMFLPGQTGFVQDRLGTAQTSNMLQGDVASLLNQTNYMTHFKRTAGDPIVRIAKSSENQSREKMAQKSAGLLRGNTKSKLGRMSSQRRNQNRQEPSSGLSIQRMIKELGDQDSMLNMKLVNLVQKRADYRTGVLDNQSAQKLGTQDYIAAQSDLDLSSQNLVMRPHKTTTSFFPAAQLQQLDKSTVGGTVAMSQFGVETADSSVNQHSSQVMLKANAWLNSAKVVDPQSTQIQWNRTRGSLLPSNNQSKGDIIPMEPITSLISSSEQDNYPAIKNHRTQVQSQNLQKRRQLSKKAAGIYYAMRQQPNGNFDLAKQRSEQFSQLDNQMSYNAFRTRHNSKGTPLEKFYQTTKGFENFVEAGRARSKQARH